MRRVHVRVDVCVTFLFYYIMTFIYDRAPPRPTQFASDIQRRMAKGVWKNMYVCVHRITGLLFLWIVFSVAFAMVTREYIHTYTYLQTAAALALCVCVTFVESL